MSNIQNGQVFVAKAAEVTAEGVSLILPGQSAATQKYYRRVAIGGAVSAGDLVLVARSSGTYVVIGAVTAASAAAEHLPYPGTNGNWMVWNASTGAYVDSGEPSRGATGPAGKSAYESAQDGGYSGTEAQFETDLADVSGKQATITASGILKGDGQGGVTAATAGTDYATPGLGLTGASVGDLVRVNAVDSNGKPTSWKRVPLNEIKCNKNLLDNWCFVGGGSQLGDGIFPINQRGQTVYRGAGYGIDRWKATNGNANVSVESNYLRFYGTNGANVWIRNEYSDQTIYGKTIVVSMLLDNGKLLAKSGKLTTDTVSSDSGFASDYENGINIGVYKKADGNFVIQIGNRQNGTSIVNADIIAVKLELGSEQTLCHNEGTEENPVWVLNEIPDYGEELRKCQRYLYIITPKIIGTFYRTNNFDMFVTLPFMQSVPTFRTNGTFNLYYNGLSAEQPTNFNMTTATIDAAGVRVTTSRNYTVGDSAYIFGSKKSFIFSCEP